MAVLRWGILGTARIGRSVIPRLQESDRHAVVAVASRGLARAEAYAAEWRIPRAVEGYAALLEAPDVDAVYVPLPNALHATWTIAAVEAGKHVLCEKPLATCVADVDAIAGAARAHRRIVAEAFMYRHHAATLKVAELVSGGAIGRVRIVRGAFSFWFPRDADARFDPDLGGGSLWDVGCYPVSFARFAIGAEPVEAVGMADVGPSGVDVTFAGQLRFPSDAILQFDSSFRADYRTIMEFVGTDGSIALSNPFKPGPREEIVLRHGDVAKTIAVEGGPLYLGELDDMADAIRRGRPPRVSLAESRGNVAAIAALLASARTGRSVRIDPPA